MIYVDSALLNLTEWLCRKFQLLTGRTNVWLAFQLTNLSIIVYFVWAGMYFWRLDGGLRILLTLFCGGLLYLLTQTIFKVPVEAYESSAYQRVAKGFRNPRRVHDAMLRIAFLTVVMFYPTLVYFTSRLPIGLQFNLRLPIALVTYSLVVLTTVVLYLLACDPIPPCAGKITEWVRGLIPARLAPSESAGSESAS